MNACISHTSLAQLLRQTDKRKFTMDQETHIDTTHKCVQKGDVLSRTVTKMVWNEFRSLGP